MAQLFMWHSGLRGAIAFALVSTLPEQVEKRSMYITSTLAIVVFTTLYVGITAPPMLRWLSIRTGDYVTLADEEEERLRRLQADRKSVWMRFHRFDKKYLLPFFTNKIDELSDERRAQYTREIGELLPSPLLDSTSVDPRDSKTIRLPQNPYFTQTSDRGVENGDDDDDDDGNTLPRGVGALN